MLPEHIAIYISSTDAKTALLKRIETGILFPELTEFKGAIFSEVTINRYIDAELRHEDFQVTTNRTTSLATSSEGERKRALLNHILTGDVPEYLVLDNVFDCLDTAAQKNIVTQFTALSSTTQIIQIATRVRDFLPFITEKYQLDAHGRLIPFHLEQIGLKALDTYFINDLPQPYKVVSEQENTLIKLTNVSVNYLERPILKAIDWTIQPGEFWQLIGPNGSGKSTLLALISGDNPKGYQQDMTLFGIKKGSGESVWDIKKHIGFYTSDMLIGFKRKDTVLRMIVSGFVDSIGLYQVPTDKQIAIAKAWLALLKLSHLAQDSFQLLSNGHKRLVLIARAMVKQPALLILDEPTNGLDDYDAKLFGALINKIAETRKTAIIYVSHRPEEYITPDFNYNLIPSKNGSRGVVMPL